MGSCFVFLDVQVSGLVEKQEILKLNNLTRPRVFSFPQDTSPPQALLAVALRHENQFYGTLWIAFESPHQYADEEVQYIVTLAGQAALAATNARLFLSAEIGRQRLESILNSTPDPVLVTDHNDNLLLTNPAAQQVFGLYDDEMIGKHISEIITQEEVLALLGAEENGQQSKELEFADGKTYIATASSVEIEGKGVGRVCVLRDVTLFKQLDASKSEFVSLRIYNMLGQEITTLVSEKLVQGNYKYNWNAAGLVSGLYFYRLETQSGFAKVKKLILLK